jgi:FkbM family methyltransferase
MLQGKLMPPINRTAWISEMKQLARDVPDLGAALSPLILHAHPSVMTQITSAATNWADRKEGAPLPVLVDAMTQKGKLCLWTGPFEFQTKHALLTIIEEILIRREYHFKTTLAEPTVIDAGANIGLASYYARRNCNAGRLICIEPHPETFAVLTRNMVNPKFDGVELHQAALAPQEGEATLFFEPDAPLASSMDPRSQNGDLSKTQVRCMTLEPLLKEGPVGLLKIDIEGAEADVLEAVAGQLGQVENIFVEVHPTAGTSPSLLIRVLAILEAAGFFVHVARSPWSEATHRNLPLQNAYRTYSLSVYGTRIGGDGQRIS